jgi:DNA polymerase-3 subunit delta'
MVAYLKSQHIKSIDVCWAENMFTSTLIIAPTLQAQQQTVTQKFGISFISHPDVLIIDELPSISIETARSIGVWLISRPYTLSKKTVVILGAERLTIPAQHALLKTLEEPPKYAHIILTVKNEYALLQTIQSRCVIVRGEVAEEESTNHHVIIPSTYPDIFALSEELGKDRGVAVAWCLQMMQNLHNILRKNPNITLRVTQNTSAHTSV